MSTHCIILNKEKTKGIYCHFDGYPFYMLPILNEFYIDEIKIEKLINLGSLSYLERQVDIPPGVLHSFENPKPEITLAYHRDRKEPKIIYNFDSYEKIYELMKQLFCDYVYVFNSEKSKWEIMYEYYSVEEEHK